MRNHFLRAAAADAGPVSTAWDLDYAEFTGTPNNSFYVENEESGVRGLFFKGDGTRMYVIGSINDSVIEYALSTAWDLSTVSYTRSFSVNSQETVPCGLFFKPDGTKMYVIGFSSDNVNEYNLSTAWDVSTASYSQNFSVAGKDTQPEGVFFKDDGTEMYVCGSFSDSVHQYGLGTAWDVSSASFTRTLALGGTMSTVDDVHFGNSGTKMYVCSDAQNRVYEYTLSTAWDISTATLSNNYYINTFESNTHSIFLKPDGSKLYAVGFNNDTVWQFNLSTNWSLASSSISYTFPSTEYLNVGSQEAAPQGIFFKSDGTKMYVIGSSGDEVNEYSLSTAWQISSASYVQNFSVATEEIGPTGLFFKPDGTKMYVIGASSDSANEYNLTTAWDISTASYNQNFSVATQETNPRSIFFKPDGTKMYVLGANRRVYEYDLSSAWDVSTASYQQNFSVLSQDNSPEGLFFKDDGSKMYVCGQQNKGLYQYGLTTSWDVSTASYEKLFSLKSYENPNGIFFKSDGTKFFTIGLRHDSAWAFTIS